MRISGTCSVVIGLAWSVAACGGGKPDPVAPTPAAHADKDKPKDDGTIRPITQGQLKVAHYASGDGVVGLVLDRTSARPKVRIDGEKDIIELTMEEDRSGGERRGWYLKSPDGKNILYLGSGGNVKVYRGRDELHVNSDKAAEPLPAATVAGEYHRPKSTYDADIEALTPLSLRHRNAAFKSEESGNLGKVAEAFASVTPDMVVHLTEGGAKSARWMPASALIGDTHQGLGGAVGQGHTDEAWDKSKPGVAKFGGLLQPMRAEFGSPNRLRTWLLKGWQAEAAKGTPGIIWELYSGTVVFVAFDGGRYEMSVSNDGTKLVEPGAGPQASWPAGLQHTLIDVDGIRGLAKGSAVPEKAGHDIEAVDDGWFTCMNDQWKKAKTEMDKIEASPASANDKYGRLGGVRKSAELNAPKTCEPKKKELDAAMTKFIEARNAERLAILEKNKTKFK